MKIKDAIRETVCKEGDVYPICFPDFTMNMAAMYVMVAAHVMIELGDYDVEINGRKNSVKEKSHYNQYEIICALTGQDEKYLIPYMKIHLQAWAFLEWFVEQDVPEEPEGEDEEWELWYSISFMSKKWNEFAMMKRD